MKKRILSLTTAFALVISLTACGTTTDYYSSSTADTISETFSYDNGLASYSYTTDVEAEEASYDVDDTTAGTDSATEFLQEKLIYRCDMDIETLDYETTINSIKSTIKKYNGIIQSENESDSSYNWYYEDYKKTSGTMNDYIEIRIPSSDYENFISELDGVGKITSKSTSVDNISQKYYDTTTQIEALQIQEQNLLVMLEKCETIEDMITVQDRLSEVRYELNSLQTSKRYMDTDVAYSYVNINVTEVLEYHYTSEPVKKNTFLDRLKNTIKNTGTGFLSFLEGLLFLLIILFPYLAIVAIICFIFRKKIKRAIANHKNQKAARNNRPVQYVQFQPQPMQQMPPQNNQNTINAQDKQ